MRRRQKLRKTLPRSADELAWLEENREAIDDYKAQVAKRGLFSDDWRRF
jgi:post-segregation antitoxin (ccd killing protein)